MRRLIIFSLILSMFLALFPGCSRKKQASLPTELSSESEVVCALINYLQDLSTSHELFDTSMAIKIDEIKNGKQALHVGFERSEYYFVCAYSEVKHKNEIQNYCCITDYTWVKFENSNEISEKYKDLSFIVAFQINKASFVTDIVTDDAALVPSVEHFLEYTPHFSDGVNTNRATFFDDSFIYLNSSDKKNVYHSKSAYYNILKTIPCIRIKERYYVTIELYATYPDGKRSDNTVVRDFGKYYDSLANIMNVDRYSVTDKKGRTKFYGLIEINDFSNFIKE